MSKDEFKRQYADRSGVTVELLRQHGQEAVQCDCGDYRCQGWQMVDMNAAKADGLFIGHYPLPGTNATITRRG